MTINVKAYVPFIIKTEAKLRLQTNKQTKSKDENLIQTMIKMRPMPSSQSDHKTHSVLHSRHPTRQTHLQRRRRSPASSFIMKWRPIFIIQKTPAVIGLGARQSKKQLGIYKFLLKWWRQFALPFCSHIDK